MPNSTLTGKVNIAGVDLSWSTPLSADAAAIWQPDLLAGVAATGWTKATGSTGTATMAEGHGITDSDIIDVYWDGGLRYGMAAVVTENSIALSGGSGDELPDSDTAIILGREVTVSGSFDGDELAALIVTGSERICVIFSDVVTTVADVQLELDPTAGATAGFEWTSSAQLTNLLAGYNVDEMRVSTDATSVTAGAGPALIAISYDSTE